MSANTPATEVGALLKQGKAFLKKHGLEAYGLCAEVLLSHATGYDRSLLLAQHDIYVDPVEYLSFLDRCIKNEPIQYITKNREFMSLEFYVDKRVLIPRPDTETLVLEAMERAPVNGSVLDIGTGSGCVAVSLAKYRPDIEVSAIDISLEALSIAIYNAMVNSTPIRFIKGDILDMGFVAGLGKFDMIVSNPPYIPSGDIAGLDSNVRDYEPLLALDGGADGLDFYRAICRSAHMLLHDGGQALFEIGFDMDGAVRGLLIENGFGGIWQKSDLAGIDRVVGGEFFWKNRM